ncbi:uncharacterized protein LOC127137151 [Lathyrus oleraceus]|uniref:uncharacterized protein LOC127137151 n=1 Tax=Pisum sativum TaxID=3888 RepID=UPI0021D36917|nr:uncharacterized protein LOC127137151 [Pisum sativum]
MADPIDGTKPLKDYVILTEEEPHCSIVHPPIAANNFELKHSLYDLSQVDYEKCYIVGIRAVQPVNYLWMVVQEEMASINDCAIVDAIKEMTRVMAQAIKGLHANQNQNGGADRDQLRSMQQREKETFREYAQRWREIAAQVVPPMEEKEMTKVFLKTLDTFYYERMIASAPTDFTDMVNMGVRLEEAVRERRLVREGSSSSSGAKRYGGFMKKKEQETNAVSYNHPRRINYPYHSQHQHIAAVTPVITSAPVQVQYPQQRTNRFQQNTQYQQQHQPQQHQHQLQQRPPQQQSRTNFDPIPMSYAELYPALITKNLVQPRPRPLVPEVLPWWYKPEVSCPFHQNASGHDLDNCFALKLEVQKLTRAGILTFKNMGPNVKDNPMPSHGPSSVNNIEVCLNEQRVTKMEEIRRSLVEIHSVLCAHGLFQHDHQICVTCSVNSRGCRKIQDDLQGVLDQGLIQISRQVSSPESQEQEVNVIIPCFNIPEKVEIAYHPREPVVICPPGPMPYTSDKAVPYRYAATIIENGKEVEIKTLASVTNIAANSRMTGSGRVFAPPVIPSRNVEKDPVVVVPVTREAEGQTSNSTLDKETDELLRIIKISDYKVVDQLLQTPSKISILSLLLNSAVHREALLKVLDQAFVEQDITTEQFNNVVGSITSCNGLGFCDEELPEEGKNHNFALHISANCQGDSLSNILIDTGSSLNVMPKSTLLKLKYKGGQMRHSGIIVKAFDGSRKTVIGEVNLPIGIGPHVFQITFQVMDIVPAYSCLLGRPWIHEAGAITSTLHQKLKFVKNGQIVTVNGEQAMLISHLSSFSVIEVDETAVQTPFQALTIDDYKKSEVSIASFKDAQQIVKTGPTEMWGKVIELPENVNHAGLGFVDGKQVQTSVVRPFKDIFHSGGFINMVAVEEDTFEGKTEDEGPRFVTPGMASRSSASKKRKVGSTSRTAPIQFDTDKFVGPKQAARYVALEKRKILPEKSREFYANALPNDDKPFTWTIRVSGRQVAFDRDAIKRVLGEPLHLGVNERDAYHRDLRLHKDTDAISSRVKLPSRSQVRIPSAIDDRYVAKYCKPKNFRGSTDVDDIGASDGPGAFAQGFDHFQQAICNYN